MIATIAELATRPGHEKVRALLHGLLVHGLRIPSTDVSFEEQGTEVRGRMDALLGRTVIEIKSDLRREADDAERQLARYLGEREQATGQVYVGIATDGAEWTAWERAVDGGLRPLGRFVNDGADAHALLAWLQSVLAVGEELVPDPATVQRELGRDSPAYRRATAVLERVWAAVGRRPENEIKRKLWGDYLAQVYGTAVGDDALFRQHTYLTAVAKTMATSVLGGRLADDAQALLHGESFAQVGIAGAIEADFFDWVLADPAGRDLVLRLARLVARFRLAAVEHDVLKGLYETLVDPEERHDLGEYYTPDWLAAWMCEHAVERPLEARVLDPACGSGTFLFQALRRYFAAAEAAGRDPGEAVAACTGRVIGVDVHPVAVTIARVTYLLAIGAQRLAQRAGSLTVPVYLGDALQWNAAGFFGRREVRVRVPAGPELHFPEPVAENPALFDATVTAMVDLSDPTMPAPVAEFRGWLRRNGITDDRDIRTLERTYQVLADLRAAGRNHIWGYVLRNLSRPFALSAQGRRVDVVIGNPPWLSYRYMATAMQARFREACQERGLWAGGKVATHQDLSAFFFAQAADLYLAEGGVMAFVMPFAALTRRQFAGFRTQSFSRSRHQFLRFQAVWAFDEDVQPLFPVPACVVFAHRGAAGPPPETVTAFHGTLPRRDAGAEEAAVALSRAEVPWPAEGATLPRSPYASRFRQGATVVPRRLWVVERTPIGRFGENPQAPLVHSRTSRQEKAPWRYLPAIERNVERCFLRPLYLGESVAPFRLLGPVEAVIPWDDEHHRLLTAAGARGQGFLLLGRWLTEAEGLWNQYRRRDDLTLQQQLDYYGKLSAQFPIPPVRVAYAASGTYAVAALLGNHVSVVEHALYWAPVASVEEGRYLTAILNSETLRRRIAARQSRGQWGARHFDKLLVNEPIPRFEAGDADHAALVALAERAEAVAEAVPVPEGLYFVTVRRRIRDALVADGVGGEIDRAVARLFG